MLEPEAFRKQMYYTEVLVTLLGLFGATLSFGALIVTRRPENCAPCPPSLRRDYCALRRASTKPWYTALTKGIRQTLGFRRGGFSICPNFCATL